jgi:hypothetical protein
MPVILKVVTNQEERSILEFINEARSSEENHVVPILEILPFGPAEGLLSKPTWRIFVLPYIDKGLTFAPLFATAQKYFDYFRQLIEVVF